VGSAGSDPGPGIPCRTIRDRGKCCNRNSYSPFDTGQDKCEINVEGMKGNDSYH
jgi:hypothetical protein